jgi:hypothetical protein
VTVSFAINNHHFGDRFFLRQNSAFAFYHGLKYPFRAEMKACYGDYNISYLSRTIRDQVKGFLHSPKMRHLCFLLICLKTKKPFKS